MADLTPAYAALEPWLVAAFVASLAVVGAAAWWRARMGGSARPADVPRAWTARFERARRALRRGRLDKSRALAADLPPTRSVRILRGLTMAALARRDGGVERVLLELGWSPGGALRGATERHAMEPGRVADVMAARCDLIDDLCADATAARPVFAQERALAIRRLQGPGAPQDAHALARWWGERRDRQAGRAGMTWASLRLLDAWCFRSSRHVSRTTGDPELVELVDLAAAAASPVYDGEDPSWRLETLIHSPHFADELGLLLVGSPTVQDLGASAIAGRLRRREALVQRALELWPAYGDALSTTRPFVLHLLTDCGARHAADVEGFGRWWPDQRGTQVAFAEQLSAGLLSVQVGDWELAEHAFREAVAAWPKRQCSRFGLAVSLEARGDLGAAEALVTQLHRDEPEEPLWHMKLGDICVLRGDFVQALAHLERSTELGPFLPGLGMRLGVVLARLGRADEALLHLRAELGPEVDVDQLNQLTEALHREPPGKRSAAAGMDGAAGGSESRWRNPPSDADEARSSVRDTAPDVDDLAQGPADEDEEPVFH